MTDRKHKKGEPSHSPLPDPNMLYFTLSALAPAGQMLVLELSLGTVVFLTFCEQGPHP